MKHNNKRLLISGLIIFILISSIQSISAIDIQDASYYSSGSFSLSQQIQNIIDTAKDGDTIRFLGKYYEDLTLVINKKLNIVSNIGTTIENSDTTNNLNTIFFINSSSSAGTTIIGFNIINDKGNGIELNNTKNIGISENNISAKDSGISIEKSSNIDINKNTIENSSDGIELRNTKNITIESNNINKNSNSGIVSYNTTNTKINKNKINKNTGDGISTYSISKNMIIQSNTITENNQGIYLNSIDNSGLLIKSNTLSKNQRGINFGNQYRDSSNKDISSNVISNNYDKDVDLRDSDYYNTLRIGSNWYGSNNLGFTNLCPKIQTDLIQAKLIKMSGGVYAVVFYDGLGKRVSDLSSLNIIFTLNDGSKTTIQSMNGIAKVDYGSLLFGSLLYQDNTIKFYVDNYNDKKVLGAKENMQDYKNYNNQNSGGSGNGNGSGNGLGNTGDNSGNTQGNDQGNTGINSGTPNNADSGEEGSSAQEFNGISSQSAKELIIEESPLFKTANLQDLSYILIVVVIGIIIVGYLIKRK
ncbi:MAG: right-handed parallel beta-helix repeat-containing protein [Methanobrevibacter sp.]|jgi:parallel beta-helix repeat protein|nr:right-handed parallel beta-helix repeat-containing protein [Methanobrevibacter sp.]